MSARQGSERRGPGRRRPEIPVSRAATRRRWLPAAIAVLALAAGAVAFSLARGGAAPPNLLLITLDTTRADILGCYGGPAPTPNLDGLARDGARMTRAYTCTPLTLPSHSTLFTSTYPFTHGVRRNGFERLDPGSTTLAEILQGAGFATEAVTGSVVLRSSFGLNQGFDRYADVDARGAANEAMAERKGNQVADLALEALRRLRGERFFLWVHFYDPHYPYESKEHPDSLSREAYADEVSFVDAQVGRILAELSDLGLAKRTVVVALGDHGEGLMDHGESEHGYFVYETTLRVPLVARGPGIPRGRTVNPVVRTLDLAPTILDWLGVPAPEGLQGHDLRRVIDGHEGDPGLAAYGETHSPEEVFGLCTLRSLVRGDTKYILATEPEMYDLAADPGERQNLAPAQATRAGEMREELRRILSSAPARPGAAPAAISKQDAELFRSLGYVGGNPETGEAGGASAELFEPRGDSPARHAAAIEAYARSHRYTSDKMWRQAEDVLRGVVSDLPDAPHPIHDLGLALDQQGRKAEMIPFLESVLARQPGSTGARLAYARQLMQAGRREEGAAQVREAAQRAPGSAAAQLEYGQLLYARKDLAGARERLRRALDLDPQSVLALQGLALVAEREDSLPAAVAYLRRAVALNPRSSQLKRELDRVQAKRP